MKEKKKSGMNSLFSREALFGPLVTHAHTRSAPMFI